MDGTFTIAATLRRYANVYLRYPTLPYPTLPYATLSVSFHLLNISVDTRTNPEVCRVLSSRSRCCRFDGASSMHAAPARGCAPCTPSVPENAMTSFIVKAAQLSCEVCGTYMRAAPFQICDATCRCTGLVHVARSELTMCAIAVSVARAEVFSRSRCQPSRRKNRRPSSVLPITTAASPLSLGVGGQPSTCASPGRRSNGPAPRGRWLGMGALVHTRTHTSGSCVCSPFM